MTTKPLPDFILPAAHAPSRKVTTSASAAVALALITTAAMSVAFATTLRPAALQALEKQGLAIVGPIKSPGGVAAYAAHIGTEPVALYVTPDGKHVIAGTMFDEAGRNVTAEALSAAVAKPMADAAWDQLAKSRWIADGQEGAARVVYVFTDPNCPYCNKLWADARPWVDAGKVQLRHVMVGILTPTSAAKAAALLSEADPAAALAAYEKAHVASNANTMAAGRPKPLGDDGAKPLASVPPLDCRRA